MVMPSSARLAHGLEHLADQFRIERGGHLVEQHDVRVHGERAGDGDALLLAAGEARRILLGLLGEADPFELMPRLFRSPRSESA